MRYHTILFSLHTFELYTVQSFMGCIKMNIFQVILGFSFVPLKAKNCTLLVLYMLYIALVNMFKMIWPGLLKPQGNIIIQTDDYIQIIRSNDHHNREFNLQMTHNLSVNKPGDPSNTKKKKN